MKMYLTEICRFFLFAGVFLYLFGCVDNIQINTQTNRTFIENDMKSIVNKTQRSGNLEKDIIEDATEHIAKETVSGILNLESDNLKDLKNENNTTDSGDGSYLQIGVSTSNTISTDALGELQNKQKILKKGEEEENFFKDNDDGDDYDTSTKASTDDESDTEKKTKDSDKSLFSLFDDDSEESSSMKTVMDLINSPHIGKKLSKAKKVGKAAFNVAKHIATSDTAKSLAKHYIKNKFLNNDDNEEGEEKDDDEKYVKDNDEDDDEKKTKNSDSSLFNLFGDDSEESSSMKTVMDLINSPHIGKKLSKAKKVGKAAFNVAKHIATSDTAKSLAKHYIKNKFLNNDDNEEGEEKDDEEKYFKDNDEEDDKKKTKDSDNSLFNLFDDNSDESSAIEKFKNLVDSSDMGEKLSKAKKVGKAAFKVAKHIAKNDAVKNLAKNYIKKKFLNNGDDNNEKEEDDLFSDKDNKEDAGYNSSDEDESSNNSDSNGEKDDIFNINTSSKTKRTHNKKVKRKIKKTTIPDISDNDSTYSRRSRKVSRKDIHVTDDFGEREIPLNPTSSDGTENSAASSSLLPSSAKMLPGLYFIGIGYDIILGNPQGTPDALIDPGYKAQIYKLEWRLSEEGLANDLTTLQPLNGWIRKEAACSRVEAIHEISSISDYERSLSAEVSIEGGVAGFGAFSGSTGYQSFVNSEQKRTSKTYFIKSSCIKFSIGLPPYVQWKKTTAFENALSELPNKFTGLEPSSKCPSSIYEEKKNTEACEDILKWMDFFKVYGTHIIIEAQLGGKITKRIEISTSSLKEMAKQGIDVKAAIKAQYGFVSADASSNVSKRSNSEKGENSFNMNQTLVVIGGNPIKDVTKEENLYEWSQTVSQKPMPVSVKLVGMDNALPTDELKKAYKNALIYYSRLYGYSPHDTIQKVEKNLISVLNASTTITKTGSPPLSADCPSGLVVLFGYVIRLNFWDYTNRLQGYEIEACRAGESSCVSKQGGQHHYDSSYLYMECGQQALPFTENFVAESNSVKNTGKCPSQYSIVFGFAMAASSSYTEAASSTVLTACRPGLKECSVNLTGSTLKSYIYLFCADSTIWTGFDSLSMVAEYGAQGWVNKYAPFHDGKVVANCPEGSKILTGFAGEHNTSNPYIGAFYNKCYKSIERCFINGRGKAIGRRNTKSLFVVMLCGLRRKQ